MRICVFLLLSALGLGQVMAVADTDIQHAFIGFKGEMPADIADELTLAGVTHGLVFPSINAVAVMAPHAILREYAEDPRVRGVRLQRKLQLHTYSSVPQINGRGVDTVGPNGSHPGVTGAGITVGVVDSGVHAAHPDLVGRVVDGYNMEFSLLQRNGEGVLTPEMWDNYVSASGAFALQDDLGHGTHCAGTIGGDGTAASGLDLRGVAPGVNIISFKIASTFNGLVEDVGFEANAVAVYDFILRNRHRFPDLRLTSNSWGILAEEAQGALGPTDFDPLKEVVAQTVADGIVAVFSAGNDGPGPETVRPIPNGMDEVITVAAACKADRGGCAPGAITNFSSRSESVDIAAPGDEIIAAQAPSILLPIGQSLEGSYFGDLPQDQAINRTFYMRLSGTSMSAPHIAGVVALVLQANPHLSPAEVEQVLIETADDMFVDGSQDQLPGFDTASGHGMVNVRAALARATELLQPAEVVEEEAEVKSVASNDARMSAAASGGGAAGLLLVLIGAAGLRRRA